MAVSSLCAKLNQANKLLAVALYSKDKSETSINLLISLSARRRTYFQKIN